MGEKGKKKWGMWAKAGGRDAPDSPGSAGVRGEGTILRSHLRSPKDYKSMVPVGWVEEEESVKLGQGLASPPHPFLGMGCLGPQESTRHQLSEHRQ